MTEFIVLSQIDVLALREDKPVIFRIDGRPFTLCTDEYFEKQMAEREVKPNESAEVQKGH